MEQTTAVALPSSSEEMDVIERIGTILAKGGLHGTDRVEQGVIIAMTCAMERITPIEFKRTYHMFNGNLTMRADAMLAGFNRRGGKHVVVERSPERAAIKTFKDGVEHEFDITWEDVQKEPYVFTKGGKTYKKNWNTPRARMQSLWARLVSDTIRVVDPGVCAGVYTPEEAGDSNPMETPDAPPAMTSPEPKTKKKAGKKKGTKTAKVHEAEVVKEEKEPEAAPPAKPEQPEPAEGGIAASLDNVEGKGMEKLKAIVVPRGKLKGTPILDLGITPITAMFEELNKPEAGDKYPEYTLEHREAIAFRLSQLKAAEAAEGGDDE